MGVAEDVMAKYPNLAFLLGDPEIGPLLVAAVDPNAGFSAETFQTKLYQTNWWRSRSQQGREQEIKKHTDPATYWSEQYGYAAEVSALAHETLGRALTPDEGHWLATVGLNAGWAPNSAMMLHKISELANHGMIQQGYGSAGVAKGQVETLARSQWFRNAPEAAKQGADIAFGRDSIESMNERLRALSWAMFPHLRPQLTDGMTLADIFNPYRQIIAEELELGSAEHVAMDEGGEWRSLLSFRDPKTKEVRLPTESEVRTMARQKPQWWKTSRGRESDAGMARTLLQTFGEIK